MNQDQKCKKLLNTLYNLSLVAKDLSMDLSSVEISEEEKYITVCQGAIASACLMYRIISDAQNNVDYIITNNIDMGENQKPSDVIYVDCKNQFPPECKIIMSNFRQMSYSMRLPKTNIDIEYVSGCAKSFDYFKKWFLSELDKVEPIIIDDEMKQRILESDFSLAEVVSQPARVTAAKRYLNDLKAIKDFILAFKQDSEVRNQAFFHDLSELVDRAKADMENLSSEIDRLSFKISELNDNLVTMQNSVSEQLKDVDDEEKKETIIADFTEHYTQYIMLELNETRSCPLYDIEESNLKNLFELSAWNKMDEKAQNFLVSARVTFNQMLLESSKLDYSGVCSLVAKALDVELAKRFYYEYLDYLGLKYEGADKYSHYPKIMLNRRGDDVLPEKHFTLGSVYYALLGFWEKDYFSQSQKEYMQAELLKYCEDTLFSGKTEDEIVNITHDYAKKAQKVADDYRNPACHRNALVVTDAIACFEYMIEGEKILKKMLDSFDH